MLILVDFGGKTKEGNKDIIICYLPTRTDLDRNSIIASNIGGSYPLVGE